MTFQKTVLMVAVVIFILVMTVVGVLMTKSKQASIYPPEVGICPDYWELDADENGNKVCRNIKELGNTSINLSPGNCKEANFEDAAYATRKSKCLAAKKCGVEWDGITNMGLC